MKICTRCGGQTESADAVLEPHICTRCQIVRSTTVMVYGLIAVVAFLAALVAMGLLVR